MAAQREANGQKLGRPTWGDAAPGFRTPASEREATRVASPSLSLSGAATSRGGEAGKTD
jgi:hypothetical protein